MNNYQYIIASLPDILLDFENHQLDYDATVSAIREHCSKKDRRLIDWLEFGSDSRNLTPHFYKVISDKKGSRFLKEYFLFDRTVRLAKVAYLENTPFEGEFEEYETLVKAFKTENLIDREKKLDMVMWEKAGELVLFDLFNIDVILAFLVRAKIVKRWDSLDPKTGTELFRRLVDEVRGTFKGIDFNPNKNE